MRASTIFSVLSALVFIAACGDDGRPTDTGMSDGATDTGTDTSPTDTGRPDTNRPDTSMDAPPADPCSTDDATSTVECNGVIMGAGAADDELFGLCVPDPDSDVGSCADAMALCYAFDADLEASARGVCVPPCAPNGTTYVNTSTCPSGSRCFDFGDGVGYCFADCDAPADCTSGQCDGDNSCVGGDGMMTDGGVDGGTDAATDSAASDSGATDTGVSDSAASDSAASDSAASDSAASDSATATDSGTTDSGTTDSAT
jgi:hypothetical protein